MFRALVPLIALLATACGQAFPPSPSTPAPTWTPSAAETRAPEANPTSPPPTASATVPGPAPTETPPSTSEPFYRLRLEYSTTSDWSTLQLLTPEHALAARLIGTEGSPMAAEAGITDMSLNQPLQAAEAGQRVGLTVDLALDPEAVGLPLRFRLQKGDIGSSAVTLSVMLEGEIRLLDEFRHVGVVPNSGGLNLAEFTVDLTPLADLAPQRAQASSSRFPHLLWAFYYPWYARHDWSSPMLSDHPLESYASSDRATIERHVRQAKAAGIDGFISSWWGPGSDTDANLRTLLDVAQQEDFLVTIYFETLTGDGHLPQEEIVRWLSYAIRSYGEHPAFARVDGKPLIVLWASGAVPLETWKESLEQVRQAGLDAFTLGMGYQLSNLEIFGGLHEYGVFTLPDLEATVSATGRGVHYYSLLQDDPSPKLWAATVQPGYDDRLIPGREGLLQERDEGAFYRRTWEAALSSDPDWIFITTWNEWWEHTHIEPSKSFGELYLDLTHEYAARWKGE